jgi:hypothetical protein
MIQLFKRSSGWVSREGPRLSYENSARPLGRELNKPSVMPSNKTR